MDAAIEGDRVRLADGWFRGPGNRDVVVADKNLTIESINGPERCILDCEAKGRGLTFTGSTIDSRTVLRGVTIFRGNGRLTGPFLRGGGVCVDLCSPTIADCTVIGSCASSGGGISYVNVGAEVGRIQDCRFFGNEATHGGAIRGSNVEIVRCEIAGNTATQSGGGVSFNTPSGAIRNSAIWGNTGFGGGGLSMIGEVEIDHCTFVSNGARQGGAIYKLDPSRTRIRNSILWGNQALGNGQQAFLTGFGPADTTFSYCDIEGGASGVESTPGSAPQFFFLLNVDPLFSTSGGSVRLSPGSPLIDAGDPGFLPRANEGDFELQPRVAGARVDVGADEVWPGLTHGLVAPGVAGASNRVEVSGAAPGELVFFFASAARGTTSYAFGACPSLTVDLAMPQFLGTRKASSTGNASYSQFVPSGLSGVSIYLQAVGFDPMNPIAGCSVSNLVMFRMPASRAQHHGAGRDRATRRGRQGPRRTRVPALRQRAGIHRP